MNKKRWLGVGVALVLLVISFAVPKYTPEIDTTSQLSSLFSFWDGDYNRKCN